MAVESVYFTYMNKQLFSAPARHIPAADTRNHAGGLAYKMDAEASLAQYACTGTFGDTFYVRAESQLQEILKVLPQCRPEFVAAAAAYGRRQGFMKDVPAYIAAWMLVQAKTDPDTWGELAELTFHAVVDNARMLRNYVQALRSGTLGTNGKHIGSRARKLITGWLRNASPRTIINASVGNDPSLADIIRLVRAKPRDLREAALWGWVIKADKAQVFEGRRNVWTAEKQAALPQEVKDLEAWQAGDRSKQPNVEFRLLTGVELEDGVWTQIARNAPWQMTRMNLNTFQRHNVLKDREMIQVIANRLRDPAQIARAKVFPYQLLMAFLNVGDTMPVEIQNALQDALEASLGNVPELPGKTVVVVDVSGSMGSPVTGYRGTATSAARFIQLASLFAASCLRKNPDNTVVIPVDTSVHPVRLNPRDTVMTNTQILSRFGGGGTALSKAFDHMRTSGIAADQVIVISDNESWADRAMQYRRTYREFAECSPMAESIDQWRRVTGSKQAKIVFNDISPNTTTPVISGPLVLNIGGFGDEVWRMVGDFVAGRHGKDYWVRRIMEGDEAQASESPDVAFEGDAVD